MPAAWDDVELELADGRRLVTQLVDRPDTVLRRLHLTGRQVPEMFARRLHGRELFGHSLDGHLLQRDGGETRLILLMDDPSAPPDFDVDTILDAAAAAAADGPDEPWEVTVVRGDRRRLVAAVPAPALGAAAVRPVEAVASTSEASLAVDTDGGPVVVGQRSIDNGLVGVTVSDDGTFEVRGGGVRLAGVGRLVDGGDYGDTYNYGAPAQDALVESPAAVTVSASESGPVRGRLTIVGRYDWPVGLTADGQGRSAISASVEVTTTIELRAGEPFLRIQIGFDNPSRDHRLRWHIPLPSPTDHSAAEGQFAVVERGLTEEAGHGEVPTPTFPAHGWVHAAGATVLLEHVSEYELVDGGRELALTILRSTGLISRNDNPFREDPAGPEVPVPGAQMIGPWRVGFGLLPHAGTWSADGVAAAAEAYHLPFVTAPGTAPASQAGGDRAGHDASPNDDRGAGGIGLRVDGPGVVLSALRRRGAELEARIVAQSDTATIALISGRAIQSAQDVDLLGRPGAELPIEPDGTLQIALGPWEIRTIRFRDRPA